MKSFLQPFSPSVYTGERMCTRLDIRLPRKSVVGLTDLHDMTIVVDWDIKPHIKQTKPFHNLV